MRDESPAWLSSPNSSQPMDQQGEDLEPPSWLSRPKFSAAPVVQPRNDDPSKPEVHGVQGELGWIELPDHRELEIPLEQVISFCNQS